ncbi:Extracellular matrix protein FRAS1 [Mycena indigotica]|uniref:Extracellular matrix protein FRAS1 n=1 Tax=Mycena indigotica TaxID=2126181 RepID=A0A8H6S9F1_9AGAR|nr:Extracellular matrix protein FRAS1 [Mycena indigotica]KAF7294566.1 Extracellular matrix protein FRAS1 [Mycena indigotica]
MFSFLLAATQVAAFGAQVASASNAIVCIAGQCLQGDSNTTLGVSLTASDVRNGSVLLLPGQYTTTTNPQLVHDLLTSPHATLNPTPGFGSNSTPSLPLNVAVSPGLAIYSQSLYSGKSAFSGLPSGPVANSSTPLNAQSMALASNIWAAVSVGSNGRVIIWDSVPDTSQLPSSNTGSMTLLDMQSATCSSPCSSSGTCSSTGTCTCAPGFNGTSCETCAAGFFGPKCQPCPAGCASCDEGISGTGRCLTPPVPSPLTACNCLNGNCNPDGSCACNSGWTTADNGTSCAKCASGFFSTSTGDCKVCKLGCASCADLTGNCLTCATRFTQDQNDATKCTPLPSSANGVTCPDGSFSDGTNCTPCSGSCSTCSGPTSNDCTSCPTSRFLTNNGSCVSASSTGVCEGSNLIADNNKGKCDTCGAKCTSCSIASFNVASTVNQLKCTGCIKGSVLSNGQCIESCPSGSFLSPKDNMTCTTCDPSCSTCSGSSTSCLTCPNNQVASNGKCVSTCPSNTFSSSGACLSCHPDCATCTGGSFSQCASCPPNRPVLSGGRCLPTCSKNQFFDTTSSSCQSCDASCSSCSGSGPGRCLACSSANQVLRGGTCVAASCNNSTSVIPGLGVCLSDLVHVLSTTTNNGTISEPTKPTPTPPPRTPGGRALAWWEILLMALGCAFIFMLFLMCWRRRARNRRAKQTAAWAATKKLNPKTNWRWRLVRFGEKLFGHRASRRAQPTPAIHLDENEEVESEAIKLMKMRNAEEARHHREMEKLQVFGAYEYSRHSYASHSSGGSKPSVLPELDAQQRVSRGSIYSSVTGVPRAGPEPRQPVSKTELSGLARYPSSILSSYAKPASPPEGRLVDVDADVPVIAPPPRITEAQAYAEAVRPSLAETHGAYWIRPDVTGTSGKLSNNPFRR